MSDAIARRRERRNRRILENAEERKRKIFGLTKKENSSIEEDDSDKTADMLPGRIVMQTGDESVQSEHFEKESLHSTHFENDSPQPQYPENDEPQFIYPEAIPPQVVNRKSSSNSPSITSNKQQSRNSPNFLENGSFLLPKQNHLNNESLFSGSNRNGINSLSEISKPINKDLINHELFVLVLALVTSLLISLGLGCVVLNSLALPFVLWEIYRLINSRDLLISQQGKTSLLSAAILLCGVQQTALSKYMDILNLIKCVSEDFALYLLTTALWQLIFGFADENANSANSFE